MKKYSQKELLNEGIWDGIKKVGGAVVSGAKALGRGLDYTLAAAAPEVRKLYRDPYYAAKGLKNAIQGKPYEKPGQSNSQGTSTAVSSDALISIKNGLQRRNVTVSNQTPIRHIAKDPQSGKDIYAVTVIDTTSPSRSQRLIYVDKNGLEITN
jgi:hypothetical protein